MKIELTIDEAQKVLATHFFNRGMDDATVTIAAPTTASFSRPLVELMPIFRAALNARSENPHATSNKIPAIRAVRQAAISQNLEVGLRDAKEFVERLGIH